MNREVYDKEYFTDDYSRQFNDLRNRYHARTQSALKRRAVDTAPMPNATTFVAMEDLSDGGVTITTGDFVRFFNEKYGHDRIQAAHASIARAQRECELKQARGRVQQESKAQKTWKKASQKRALRPRFSFARAVMGMMLILSIALLFGTSLALDQTKEQVMELQSAVESMQGSTEEVQVAQYGVVDAESLSFAAADSVEVYTPREESAMSVLLNALSSLGK